jgi:hypothetical protein
VTVVVVGLAISALAPGSDPSRPETPLVAGPAAR